MNSLIRIHPDTFLFLTDGRLPPGHINHLIDAWEEATDGQSRLIVSEQTRFTDLTGISQPVRNLIMEDIASGE